MINVKHRNFLVFINPISGSKNKAEVQTHIETTLSNHHYPYKILPTVQTGVYDYLKNIIYTDKITDIIICGGDGTVNQIVTYTLGIPVNIGIIPMGSGNGLAFCAGIPKDPKKALAIIMAGHSKHIDSFWVNKQFSCHLIGLGFDAQVAHDFANQPKRGPSSYVKQVAKNFFKAKTFPFQIKFGEEIINTEAFFICIANSNQFGNKIKIAPKASLSDGLLDIVLVNKTNKFNVLVKVFKQLLSGKVVELDGKRRVIQYWQTKKLSVTNPDKAPLHIDGEPMKTGSHFEIEIIENAFLLLQS